MDVILSQCDHCKKKTENRCAERGWIYLGQPTSISRSVGRMGKLGYDTDFLSHVRDFCSITCLVAALDQKAREREDEKVKAEKVEKAVEAKPS